MRAILALMAGLGLQPAVAQTEAQFRSPTGNIHCYMFAGDGDWWGARCDILEATLSFSVPPADCDLDWGHAFEVPARGQAGPICAGDTVADPGAPVLGYGRSVAIGGVVCTSEEAGMTCQNREGRGFSLSRARQRVF